MSHETLIELPALPRPIAAPDESELNWPEILVRALGDRIEQDALKRKNHDAKPRVRFDLD